MFAEYCDSIPDLKMEDERDTEKLFSIQEALALHPSFSMESPEIWIYFLTRRPDLCQDDKDCVMKIIHKLWQNQNYELEKQMLDWSREEKTV